MTTRRLAAILAADVAGFSAMMERDEEGTAARIRALRADVIEPTLARHHGRLVKTMGDGFLAEFASPVEAVRSALAIQDQLSAAIGVSLRIGINLGDIIIEDDGDVLGDGVNVAARLEQMADPGGICISAWVHDQIVGKIDRSFEDRGEQQVKNIARAVRVYALGGAAPRRSEPKPLPLPDKPSIAVLPFTNMSGDPEQEYFADGIAEDITAGLSRSRILFVIARSSSFAYRGRSLNLRQVARELGVRYVLQGSVRKSSSRLRVSVELVAAEENEHIWAERYDRTLADMFDVQDEVTANVIAAIEPRLHVVESLRAARKRPQDMGAWDCVARAVTRYWRLSKPDHEAAVALALEALQIDPTYAQAHGFLAHLFSYEAQMGWADSLLASAKAVEHARAALAMDHTDAYARMGLGYAHMISRRTQNAASEFRTAIEFDPNLAWGHAWLACALSYLGEGIEALDEIAMARRMSPKDPFAAAFHSIEGLAHFVLGNYAEAAGMNRLAVAQQPEFTSAHRTLSVALALAGRVDEARVALSDAVRLQPTLSFAWVEKSHPLFRQADRARYIEGLRLAGLPE